MTKQKTKKRVIKIVANITEGASKATLKEFESNIYKIKHAINS